MHIVGGSGDHGADVLGIKHGQLWVIQCKFRRDRLCGASAVDEVVAAARYYGADRLGVATSQPFSPAMQAAITRWETLGVRIEAMPRSVLSAMACCSPQYSASRHRLRRYQRACVVKVRAALQDTGRVQMVLATGLGKSVIMAEATAALWRDGRVAHGRALVLADKVELIGQLQRAFWQQLPKDVPTHLMCAGESPTFWDGITFATVQSAAAQLWQLPPFGLVWVDEAHHVGARVFRDVIAHVGAPMLGGATATPWRGDRYDIDEVLGEPVVRIGIAEGMRRRFLCEVDYRLLADDIDWALVRCHSAHGYSLRDLNTRLLIPIRDAEVARTLAQVFAQEQRRGLVVFCPSVAHAHVFAATLRLFGFGAGAITSTMPVAARRRVMAQFRKGQLNAVTTVDVFNEGVDVPDVDMLAFMRVTHSRRIFVQQMGRGLRVAPGKNKVIVMDFVSDLRRLADVIGLQRAVGGKLECLAAFERLVQFREKGAAQFMFEWLLDQADLFSRKTDAELLEPAFDFPEPLFHGADQ